jgi:CBS-domain-containing membrane protein
VRSEYSADHLAHVMVRDVASRDVITMRATDLVSSVRAWLASGAGGATHQGFPVVRLEATRELVGILSRSDLLAAHAPRLDAAHELRTVRRLSLTSNPE